MIRRDYIFGGQSTFWYSTEYDLLGRPTNATDSVSLVREWLYNRRSELAAANIGTNCYGYAYDTIGNRLRSASNAATNSYTVNCLNQYTSIAASTNLAYDGDGNLTNDGTSSYSYNAENRPSTTARARRRSRNGRPPIPDRRKAMRGFRIRSMPATACMCSGSPTACCRAT